MASQNFNPSASSGYGWIPPRSPSPYVRVLLLYLESTENWNYDAFMVLFDDSLQHWTLPASLGRPVLTKRQYGEYLKAVRPMFKTFKVTVNEVIEADSKMSVHVMLNASSHKGTVLNMEYVLLFHFTSVPSRDGADALPRITMVKEFLDSAASTKFFLEERKPRETNQAGFK